DAAGRKTAARTASGRSSRPQRFIVTDTEPSGERFGLYEGERERADRLGVEGHVELQREHGERAVEADAPEARVELDRPELERARERLPRGAVQEVEGHRRAVRETHVGDEEGDALQR